MGLKEIFQKHGGMNLIKQYARAGVLGTAIGEFLLLGKSRTALEILRMAVQFKTKIKLKRKYMHVLDDFEKEYDASLIHRSSNKIWICWFQGMENAPKLVQQCYRSVIRNNQDKEVILLTEDNISNYVSFPRYIIEKWKCGKITHTHMTDLLRLELLVNYGGLWLDATVLCTGQAPSYFFESDLFFFQSLKPGRDGHATYISSWLMEAKTNNKILMATRELCYEYWKKNDSMCDYFLLHDFMSIVLERYEDDWRKVIPRDNSTPHILLLRLFDKYNENMWKAIIQQSQFHKLTYKFDNSNEDSDTYYNHIVENLED